MFHQQSKSMTSTYIIQDITFVHVGSSIASNTSIDTEINCHFGKASDNFPRLCSKIFEQPKLTIRSKSTVSCLCFQYSVQLYRSKTWTLSSVKEMKINCFHQRCLHSNLKFRRQQQITNE